MNQIWPFLSITLIISGLTSLLIAIRTWLIRSRPGQAAFAGLMLAVGTFSIFSGFELIAPTTGEKTFWLILENLGIVWLGPFWFLFVIGYTQRKWITPRWTVLLLVIPTLTILLFISGLWK